MYCLWDDRRCRRTLKSHGSVVGESVYPGGLGIGLGYMVLWADGVMSISVGMVR